MAAENVIVDKHSPEEFDTVCFISLYPSKEISYVLWKWHKYPAYPPTFDYPILINVSSKFDDCIFSTSEMSSITFLIDIWLLKMDQNFLIAFRINGQIWLAWLSPYYHTYPFIKGHFFYNGHFCFRV